MEIETMDNTEFEITAHILDVDMELTSPITYQVNNSLGYSAVSGAVFYMNPKTRSNRQGNRQEIINEMDGSVIPGSWENMNWGNDGWQADEDGNKVLRLMAGSSLRMGYSPFKMNAPAPGRLSNLTIRLIT